MFEECDDIFIKALVQQLKPQVLSKGCPDPNPGPSPSPSPNPNPNPNPNPKPRPKPNPLALTPYPGAYQGGPRVSYERAG